MKIKELLETATAGSTSAAMGAVYIKPGSGPDIGTLFGGSYEQKPSSKKRPKAKKESIIKR
jgi:hypothetical protein